MLQWLLAMGQDLFATGALIQCLAHDVIASGGGQDDEGISGKDDGVPSGYDEVLATLNLVYNAILGKGQLSERFPSGRICGGDVAPEKSCSGFVFEIQHHLGIGTDRIAPSQHADKLFRVLRRYDGNSAHVQSTESSQDVLD